MTLVNPFGLLQQGLREMGAAGQATIASGTAALAASAGQPLVVVGGTVVTVGTAAVVGGGFLLGGGIYCTAVRADVCQHVYNGVSTMAADYFTPHPQPSFSDPGFPLLPEAKPGSTAQDQSEADRWRTPPTMPFPANSGLGLPNNTRHPYPQVFGWGDYLNPTPLRQTQEVGVLCADTLFDAIPFNGPSVEIGPDVGFKTSAILKTHPNLSVTGIEVDANTLSAARRVNASYGERAQFAHGYASDVDLDQINQGQPVPLVYLIYPGEDYEVVARTADAVRFVAEGGVIYILSEQKVALSALEQAIVQAGGTVIASEARRVTAEQLQSGDWALRTKFGEEEGVTYGTQKSGAWEYILRIGQVLQR